MSKASYPKLPKVFWLLLFLAIIFLFLIALEALQAKRKAGDVWLGQIDLMTSEDVFSSGTLNLKGQEPPYFKPIGFIFSGDGDGINKPYLLEISEEGFWVKGVKVDDTPEGYQEFYEAFKAVLEGRIR